MLLSSRSSSLRRTWLFRLGGWQRNKLSVPSSHTARLDQLYTAAAADPAATSWPHPSMSVALVLLWLLSSARASTEEAVLVSLLKGRLGLYFGTLLSCNCPGFNLNYREKTCWWKSFPFPIFMSSQRDFPAKFWAVHHLYYIYVYSVANWGAYVHVYSPNWPDHSLQIQFYADDILLYCSFLFFKIKYFTT